MEEEILYGSKPVTSGPKRFAGTTPSKTPNKVRKVCSMYFYGIVVNNCFDILCVDVIAIMQYVQKKRNQNN